MYGQSYKYSRTQWNFSILNMYSIPQDHPAGWRWGSVDTYPFTITYLGLEQWGKTGAKIEFSGIFLSLRKSNLLWGDPGRWYNFSPLGNDGWTSSLESLSNREDMEISGMMSPEGWAVLLLLLQATGCVDRSQPRWNLLIFRAPGPDLEPDPQQVPT